jgi:hypothetical protein
MFEHCDESLALVPRQIQPVLTRFHRSAIDRKIRDRKMIFGEGRPIFLSSNLSVPSVLPTRFEQGQRFLKSAADA